MTQYDDNTKVERTLAYYQKNKSYILTYGFIYRLLGFFRKDVLSNGSLTYIRF